jgi:hypothetical protein
VSGKRVVQVDSLFETVLGLVLVVGVAVGWLDEADFPAVGAAVLALLGLALVCIGVVLWRVAGREVPDGLLRSLAYGNLGTAAALLLSWLAFGGFSSAGAAIALTTVAMLTLLGAGQLRQARGNSTTNVAPAPGAE